VAELTESFVAKHRGLIAWMNFAVPTGSPYALEPSPATARVARANGEVAARLAEQPQARVLDLDRLASFHGKMRMTDPRMEVAARVPWSPDFLAPLSRAVLALVKAASGLTRKVLVLDLDNTLWGGVVGEDGLDGLTLGPEGPGRAYVAFQRAVLELWERGILLAVNSKNNPDDALAVLRKHPHMVLREEHFAAMRINWQDKATNLREIADELRLGSDSFVFVDDQPAERALVREVMPEVLTPDWPADATEYVAALHALNDFERLHTTDEDRRRAAMYREESDRERFRTSAASLRDYLAGLGIVATLAPVRESDVPRVAQLTQKTNQFNLTTIRYQERDIRDFAAAPDARVLTLHVRDRFGDAGLVGVAIIRIEGPSWRLDTLLLSCRVMSRRIEFAWLGALAADARAAGAQELRGEYRATPKNGVVRDLFAEAGFSCVATDDARSEWRLSLGEAMREEPHVRVEWMR
jgi:FkbH-like protein